MSNYVEVIRGALESVRTDPTRCGRNRLEHQTEAPALFPRPDTAKASKSKLTIQERRALRIQRSFSQR